MLQTLGTIALVLICPLMMVFMMRGMHGGHSDHKMRGQAKLKCRSPQEKLAALRGQLDDLQAQYDHLEHTMHAETSPTSAAVDRYREKHF